MQERRLLLAILLSMLVLYAWQLMYPPPPPPRRAAPRIVDTAALPATVGTDSVTPSPLAADSPALPAPAEFFEAADTRPARRITLVMPKFEADLAETGGVIDRWQLVEYLCPRETGEPARVVMVSPPHAGHAHLAVLMDRDDKSRLAEQFWRADEGDSLLTLKLRPRAAEIAPGVTLEKRFEFTGAYGCQFTFSVVNGSNGNVSFSTARLVHALTGASSEGSFQLHLGPGLGTNLASYAYADQYAVTGAFSRSGKREAAVVEKSWWHSLFGVAEPPTDCDWVALENRYFVMAMKPVDFKVEADFSAAGKDGIHLNILLPSFSLNAGERRDFRFRIYTGPKSTEQLSRFSPEFEQLDGMEPSILPRRVSIARWMVGFLGFIQSFVGNWGWSIIILTVIVRALLYPLSYYQFKSMAKMQKLKPQIDELQVKYANDKERLQRELMKVYSEAGVNPLGGCLPILIQMPILIGLFLALQNSIDMRGAPFILWIRDLSIPDTLARVAGLPINPLPLVMCYTMYYQQKITPMPTADPAQRQMFTMMTVMMTVLFYNFPSGLSLYWVTQNILSIGQQLYMVRYREVSKNEKAPDARRH